MPNPFFRTIATAVLIVLSTALPHAIAADPTTMPSTQPISGPEGETATQRDARMAWWRDARFGMFIHWGAYSVPADGEWYMTEHKVPVADYERYATELNPVKFDADKIAAVAEAAGQKYLVITSKHHDGFCMFKTKTTLYNIVDVSPWHQDPLAALAAACDKHHVKFCVYYSIMDWHSPYQIGAMPNGDHPTYNPTKFRSPDDKVAYIAYMKAQLKELITQYHPGLIWFDGDWLNGWTRQDGRDLLQYLYELDPKLIVNNRVGGNGVNGDYGTPEQEIPPNGLGRDWETCMTINGSWGVRTKDTGFKSTATLLHNLIDIASKGGNYLLNVGPTAEGEIPRPEIDRLAEMGAWLKVNGDAIYGTKASPFADKFDWGRCTRKGNTVYAIVFDWPKDGKLTLPLKTAVKKAYFLSDNIDTHGMPAMPPLPLTVTKTDGGVTLGLPATAPDPIASVVALECEK
jgi:alpha-L-fucosidase